MTRKLFPCSWAKIESVPQQKIIAWLLPRSAGKRILNVGAGNSNVALKLPLAEVFEITVSEEEKALADGLGIICELMDKFDTDCSRIPGKFDHIVDVDPFSYAMDVGEIDGLMRLYWTLLRPKGSVVSHVTGLQYRWLDAPVIFSGDRRVIPLALCKEWTWPCFRWEDREDGIVELIPRWEET